MDQSGSFEQLYEAIQGLHYADLCLIYENEAEWRDFTLAFIKSGLVKKEKCYYIFDIHYARQVLDTLSKGGIDISTAEDSGQLAITHGNKIYIQKSRFKPESIFTMLSEETRSARLEGFTGMRWLTETEFILSEALSGDTIKEFEAKISHEYYSEYPCLTASIYDLKKLKPEIIRILLMTHRYVVLNNRACRSPYFIPASELLSGRFRDTEPYHWLNNTKRFSV